MSDEAITRLNAALQDRYRVDGELGRGGMATVYLAEDLRHKRRVALKVLRPELSAIVGAERFLAEIEVTAKLQHPHILPLFDSGQADSFLFYVMPYVEGESLRTWLDRQKQLSVSDAVRVTKAVAGALGYAHKRGVIHRDVKPENVLLHEGEPLVADFGIALAVSTAGGSRLTETGLSLGTPFYMSPEQASADRELGPVSDIYSLGCMLHEMLVGEPPHTGRTAQAILTKILTERPRPVSELRSTVPSNVAGVVARAIERLPADRFASAEELIRALEDSGFRHDAATSPPLTAPASSSAESARAPLARRVAHLVPWGVAAVATGLALWTTVSQGTEPTAAVPLRMALTDLEVDPFAGVLLAISPTGDQLVVRSSDHGISGLYLRSAEHPEFRVIAGTRNGTNPTFSPDGQWLAFQVGTEIRKTPLAGGPTLPVAEGSRPHWGLNGTIVFACGGGLCQVSGAGGTPEVILAPDTTGVSVTWPHMLPHGRGVLFSTGATAEDQAIKLLDLASGEVTHVADRGSNPRYVASGHVVFGHVEESVASLLAVPFDLGTLKVTDSAVPVLASITVFVGGATQLAVSDRGTVLYAAGGETALRRLTWVDMTGGESPLPLTPGAFSVPRISPDGRRIAYQKDSHIWIYDVDTGSNQQLTFEGTNEYPLWSRDGRFIYFTSQRAGTLGSDGFRQGLDGLSPPEQLYARPAQNKPAALSPDNRWLVVREGSANLDIALLDLQDDSARFRNYLHADWNESLATVSPDGRWLAYSSNESGVQEVYVRGFPDPAGPWRVSDAGGTHPVWAPDASALYYWSPDALVRAEVGSGNGVVVRGRTPLFARGQYLVTGEGAAYDVHPDGKRFLMVTADTNDIGDIFIVANWFEEMKARMGEAGTRPE
jgi:Tol biopolymer transport system component/tRNA A-37 threonylcarbamoyl transferase component Bud32